MQFIEYYAMLTLIQSSIPVQCWGQDENTRNIYNNLYSYVLWIDILNHDSWLSRQRPPQRQPIRVTETANIFREFFNSPSQAENRSSIAPPPTTFQWGL